MNGRHLNALRPSAGGCCCFRDEIRTPQPQAEKPDRAGVNCDTTPHRIGAKEHGLVFLDHPQTDVDFLEDLQIPCPCVEILRLWNAERNTAPEMPRALRKAAWARSTQEDRSSRGSQLAIHGRTAHSSTTSLGAASPTRSSGPDTGESEPDTGLHAVPRKPHADEPPTDCAVHAREMGPHRRGAPGGHELWDGALLRREPSVLTGAATQHRAPHALGAKS